MIQVEDTAALRHLGGASDPSALSSFLGLHLCGADNRDSEHCFQPTFPRWEWKNLAMVAIEGSNISKMDSLESRFYGAPGG